MLAGTHSRVLVVGVDSPIGVLSLVLLGARRGESGAVVFCGINRCREATYGRLFKMIFLRYSYQHFPLGPSD
jgi:hypothetical protein